MRKQLKEIYKVIIYSIKTSFEVSVLYSLIKLILEFITSLSGVLIAISTSRIIDLLAQSDFKEMIGTEIIVWITVLSATYCLSGFFGSFITYIYNIHHQLMEVFHQKKIMEKSCKADIEVFDDPKYFDNYQMSIGAYSYVETMLQGLITLFSTIISCVIAIYLVCQYNILYSIVIIVVTIPYIILSNDFLWKKFSVKVKSTILMRKANYYFYLATDRTHALETRLFGLKNYFTGQFGKFSKEHIYLNKKVLKREQFTLAFCDLISQIAITIMIIFVILDIVKGKASLGSFSLYMGMFLTLKSGIINMSIGVLDIIECKLHVLLLLDFLNAPNKVENKWSTKIEEINKIEFRNVSFKYPLSKDFALKDVSFCVKRGERVGIVGINGAGKSTIVKLILRYYDVTKGNIYINDVDIVEFDIDSYRKQISACFQDITSYGFTLRDNILMSKGFEDISDSYIHELIEKCNAGDILEKAPDGLDSYITKYFDEDGMELSGGQYQKISLARTYYRDSSLVILDEPSASLDPEAEDQVFKIMSQLLNNKVVFFITHRLANIKMANRILVIDNGKLIANGSHEELMQNSKRYKTLYNYQADKFI